MKIEKTTVQAELPKRLAADLEALVAAGWYRSVDELVGEALRRFIETHQSRLMEEFVRQDVEWGLRGND
ncbi:MAG: ribbon-helix-helix domain-containing protein [Acidobacteriota bacterium]